MLSTAPEKFVGKMFESNSFVYIVARGSFKLRQERVFVDYCQPSSLFFQWICHLEKKKNKDDNIHRSTTKTIQIQNNLAPIPAMKSSAMASL